MAMNHSIADEVRWNFSFACLTWDYLERSQLLRAFEEAVRLAESGLFEAEFKPSICVDEYGEFSFSHESKAGYVDIGVRGVGELSYHVRNDIEPGKTAYDDLLWTECHAPQRLYDAIAALRKHL